jgi:hypothetical protein
MLQKTSTFNPGMMEIVVTADSKPRQYYGMVTLSDTLRH